MSDCPCCSHKLLRHIRGNQVVLFCRHCWQDMPELSQSNINLLSRSLSVSLSPLVATQRLVTNNS